MYITNHGMFDLPDSNPKNNNLMGIDPNPNTKDEGRQSLVAELMSILSSREKFMESMGHFTDDKISKKLAR